MRDKYIGEYNIWIHTHNRDREGENYNTPLEREREGEGEGRYVGTDSSKDLSILNKKITRESQW